MTSGALVGLDVEESQRTTHSDPLRLARRRFSAAEIASMEGGAFPFFGASTEITSAQLRARSRVWEWW